MGSFPEAQPMASLRKAAIFFFQPSVTFEKRLKAEDGCRTLTSLKEIKHVSYQTFIELQL